MVAINRALAISGGAGAGGEAGEIGSHWAADGRLAQLPALHGRRRRSFWPRTGAAGEAREAYEIAIGLERDPAVRRFLQQHRDALRGRDGA